MHYIGIKQRIRNKLDSLFRINHSSDYGYLAQDAFLAPDVIVFSKKNLFLYENTSIPEGGGNSKSSIKVYNEAWILLKL